MPFTAINTSSTIMRTDCVWLYERMRQICISYQYCGNGELVYAASVYRKPYEEYKLTENEIENHEHTTTQRFMKRPVYIHTYTMMNPIQIINEIRYQMCRGPGCKGPRLVTSSESTCSSENDFASETSSMDMDYQPEFRVSEKTLRLKTIYTAIVSRVDSDAQRTFFISFKGSTNGEIIYGACIMKRTEKFPRKISNVQREEHFNTSEDRLLKCPVHLKINKEIAKAEMPKNSTGKTSIVELIMDNIYDRNKGRFQIRGERL